MLKKVIPEYVMKLHSFLTSAMFRDDREFLISSFRRVLHVVSKLLGCSPAYGFY
jgi:hypothetical protein